MLPSHVTVVTDTVQAIALGLDVARDSAGAALIVTVESGSNETETQAALSQLAAANVRAAPSSVTRRYAPLRDSAT